MATQLQKINSALQALNNPIVKSKKKSLWPGVGIGLSTLGGLGGASVLYDNYEREKRVNKVKKDALAALSGAGAGGLGGYGLTSLMTKNKLLRALGALGGVVAGGFGGKYLADKYASEKKIANMNNKFAKNTDDAFVNNKELNSLYKALRSRSNLNNNELIKRINNLEDRLAGLGNLGLDVQYDLKDKVKGISTLLGTGVGGLGGYGLTSLMTKNKWLRALGTLGGGVAGGITGSKLASVNKKYDSAGAYTFSQYKDPDNIIDILHKSLKNVAEERNQYKSMNGNKEQGVQILNDQLNKIRELKSDYKLLNEDYQKVNNKYHELNKLFNLSRAVHRATLGAGVGGLGGYGLTSLMTKNKWLRALGTLGGGVVGGAIGFNPIYWRNKTRDLWHDTKAYSGKAIDAINSGAKNIADKIKSKK